MSWQNLLVVGVVTAAFVYAGILAYRKLKLFRARPAGHSEGSGECPGCGTCEKNPKTP